jgi:N-acetylglutamate synthase-like GNAT family acetyltransferase
MIRRAVARDLPAVLALLSEAKLPTEGVAEHFHSFFVAEGEGGRIVASAGLELRGDAALLRSLVVAADARGAGVGAAVLRRALHEAEDRAGRIYALTTTAEGYLARFGFEPVPRAELPAQLFESRELQDACPASAAVMKWVQRPSICSPASSSAPVA